MASITVGKLYKRGDIWYFRYTDHDGRRSQRSTGKRRNPLIRRSERERQAGLVHQVGGLQKTILPIEHIDSSTKDATARYNALQSNQTKKRLVTTTIGSAAVYKEGAWGLDVTAGVNFGPVGGLLEVCVGFVDLGLVVGQE